MSALRPVLARSRAWVPEEGLLYKPFDSRAWGLFWQVPGPEPQNARNESPGVCFGEFPHLGPKMLEMNIVGLVLASSLT